MDLKIINLNCFESPLSMNRKDRIWDLIFKIINLNPGIVCLQEINFSQTAYKISEIFRNEGYEVFYDADLVFNRGGLFIASRYPIESADFKRFKNQGTFFSLQITDRVLGKGYQKVTLSIIGSRITLYNAHLATAYRGNSEAQNKTLRSQFNQIVEDIKNQKENLIVAGDFNFSPESTFYTDFLNETGLVDPLSDTNSITISRNNTHKNGFYRMRTDGKSDYTFVSREISKDISQKVIFEELIRIKDRDVNLSDHFGLLTLGSL